MARYIGPKNRLARRIGRDLGLKTNSVKLSKRLQVPPGQHGPKGIRRKNSDYSIQLKEKQKVRFTYGILEKQFKKYYVEASKNPKATGLRLLQLLELRLDNVVYRLGFAPTRAAARQFVTHGHIKVNNKKLDIPSYRVRQGEQISLSEKIMTNPDVKQLLSNKKYQTPKWLERKAVIGKIIAEPQREEIESDFEEQLIVEYYSR